MTRGRRDEPTYSQAPQPTYTDWQDHPTYEPRDEVPDKVPPGYKPDEKPNRVTAFWRYLTQAPAKADVPPRPIQPEKRDEKPKGMHTKGSAVFWAIAFFVAAVVAIEAVATAHAESTKQRCGTTITFVNSPSTGGAMINFICVDPRTGAVYDNGTGNRL